MRRPGAHIAPWRCALPVLFLPLGLWAQAQGDSILEEVVVSATRIPTEWTRLPVSAGWVDRDEIQLGRQQLGLDESLANIPGVFSQNRYNFAQDLRVSIRGFGARANFGIRGLMLIADDIPLTMPDGQANVDSVDLGSAQSVEVIRGAVSAIYGASSGGVINIHTEDGPENPFVSGRFSLGNYGYALGQVKAGGQAGALNWIVNLSGTRLDGYREQSLYKRSLWNSKFRYEYTDGSTLTLVFNAVNSPTAQDPGALTWAEVQANRRQAAPRNLLFDADEAVQQQALGLAWRKNLNDSQELLLRAWAVNRDFRNLLPFDINSNGQGGSVDLQRKAGGVTGHWSWSRSLGDGGQNRLVLGFDVAGQRDLRKRFVNEQGLQGKLTTLQDEDVSSASLFFEDAWDISRRLSLTLGGRFDDMEYSVTDRTGAGGSGESGFQEFSPMLGLSWSRSPEFNLYGNVSTSFDPPAIAELVNPDAPTGFNQDLGPQTATNYEIGLRGVAADRFRYELVLFHIPVRDEIVPFEQAGSGQSFFRNAGKSTHDGVEAGLIVDLGRGLTGRIAYTWSDFTFDRFSDPDGSVFDGNRIPGVPENQAHLDLAWTHPSGWYAGCDFLYVGPFFADNANRVRTQAYFVSNFRAGYRRSAGPWMLEPFFGVNNLFDRDYMDNIRINASFGRYYEPAPERNIYAGLELRYSF